MGALRRSSNERHHADGRVELVDTTRVAASPLYNHDLAPVPVAARNWTTYNYAALWISMAHCIPTYMLAVGPDGGGHELVAGALHDPARQHDRPRPDPAELAPRHEVRHPVPRLRPRRLRHARLEPAGAHARARRLRLVRHPGLDRRGGAAHVLHQPRPGLADAARARASAGHTTTEWLSFLLFWGLNIFIIYRGMDLLRMVENWAAPFVLVMTARPARGGRSTEANGLGPAPRAAGQVPHARRVPARLHPVADGDDRLLGDALAQHAGLHALRPQPARAGDRPGRGAADDDVRLRGDGRPHHERDRDHLRRGDLGSGQARRAASRSPVVVAISMFTAVVATLAVNIAANVVSPANDFANAFPRLHQLQDRRPDHRHPRHR